jgi:hypothetical protein
VSIMPLGLVCERRGVGCPEAMGLVVGGTDRSAEEDLVVGGLWGVHALLWGSPGRMHGLWSISISFFRQDTQI